LKPLMTIQTPSDSSQKKIGATAIPDHIVMVMPNSPKTNEEMSSGVPMSPAIGIIRGTSRDRYIRVPSSRALRAGIRLGPIANVQLRTATSARPTVTSVAASVPSALSVLSSLIAQMKRKLDEYDRQLQRQKSTRTEGYGGTNSEGIIEDAFSLTDQIMTLLPEVTTKRWMDSLVFGFDAFILVLIVVQNVVASIIAGTLVGLYFAYETNRSHSREVAKFEEQRRNYEDRKNDFLATL